jgi:hypothetical protein
VKILQWYVNYNEKVTVYFNKMATVEVGWHICNTPTRTCCSVPFSAQGWMQESCLPVCPVHCYKYHWWRCLYIIVTHVITVIISNDIFSLLDVFSLTLHKIMQKRACYWVLFWTRPTDSHIHLCLPRDHCLSNFPTKLTYCSSSNLRIGLIMLYCFFKARTNEILMSN